MAVPFPSGSLITAAPAWQTRAESAEKAMPGFMAGAAALLAGGIAALWALWARGRRPETAVGFEAARSSTLPDQAPPAIAGALVAAGKPGASHALGALFSLAQRDVLVIEESPEKHWYRPHEFVLRVLDPAPCDLRPHEKALLDLLFTEKAGQTDTVKLSEAGTRLTSKLSRFSEPLTAELLAARFIDPERQATAKRFMLIGVGLLFMMIPLGVLGVALVPSGWRLAIPAGCSPLPAGHRGVHPGRLVLASL